MPAKNAPVAQLDRAPDYESGGQEFESLRARHFSTIQNKTANYPSASLAKTAAVCTCTRRVRDCEINLGTRPLCASPSPRLNTDKEAYATTLLQRSPQPAWSVFQRSGCRFASRKRVK